MCTPFWCALSVLKVYPFILDTPCTCKLFAKFTKQYSTISRSLKVTEKLTDHFLRHVEFIKNHIFSSGWTLHCPEENKWISLSNLEKQEPNVKLRLISEIHCTMETKILIEMIETKYSADRTPIKTYLYFGYRFYRLSRKFGFISGLLKVHNWFEL